MTNEAYTLAQTNKERKTTARSASHRVNGSKSRRCTLPSDHMTPAQIRKLSGPVITYNMDTAHTWKELLSWPYDLREQYVVKLLSLNPDNSQLGYLLDLNPTSISRQLATLGIHRGRGGHRPVQTNEQYNKWCDLLGVPRADGTMAQDDPPEEEEEEIPETPKRTSAVTSVSLALASATITDLISTLAGDPLIRQLTDTYHITLTIEKR